MALAKVLEEIGSTVAYNVLKPALTKACRVIVKHIKKETPSRYKSVRKAIGFRVKKAKKTDVTVEAKAGAAVGKRPKAGEEPSRKGNRGVGISRANVHWWFLGTKRRTQKTTGRYTGYMDPQSRPVSTIVGRHGVEIAGVLKQSIADGVQKQAAKAAAKKGKK